MSLGPGGKFQSCRGEVLLLAAVYKYSGSLTTCPGLLSMLPGGFDGAVAGSSRQFNDLSRSFHC